MELIIFFTSVSILSVWAILPNCEETNYEWIQICDMLDQLREADSNFRTLMQQTLPTTTDPPNTISLTEQIQCEAGPSAPNLPQAQWPAQSDWYDLEELVLGIVEYKHQLEILRHQTEQTVILNRAIVASDYCPSRSALQTRIQVQQRIADELMDLSTSVVKQLQHLKNELLARLGILKTDNLQCNSTPMQSDELQLMEIPQQLRTQDISGTLTAFTADLRRQNYNMGAMISTINAGLRELNHLPSQMP